MLPTHIRTRIYFSVPQTEALLGEFMNRKVLKLWFVVLAVITISVVYRSNRTFDPSIIRLGTYCGPNRMEIEILGNGILRIYDRNVKYVVKRDKNGIIILPSKSIFIIDNRLQISNVTDRFFRYTENGKITINDEFFNKIDFSLNSNKSADCKFELN